MKIALIIGQVILSFLLILPLSGLVGNFLLEIIPNHVIDSLTRQFGILILLPLMVFVFIAPLTLGCYALIRSLPFFNHLGKLSAGIVVALIILGILGIS